jgi:cobalamin biosynthesis protein CobD/CbiB
MDGKIRDYNQLNSMLKSRMERLHDRNRRRIHAGYLVMFLLTPLLLFVRWFTDSDRMVFLLIWVFCMFTMAGYLISVSYLDHYISQNTDNLMEPEEEEVP